VNVDLSALNVLQNPHIGRWLSPDVVVLWQAVHRDSHAKSRDLHPLRRYRDHTTGDDHREHSRFAQRRKNLAEFAMPNEWLATDEGDVQRLMPFNKPQYAADKCLTPEIA
jgi:hypothetical protein